MVDNSTAAAGPTIATDDIGGVHYQRTKIGRGVDGAYRDSSDSYTTGTITAANANPTTGVATAGSTVQITVPDAHSAWQVMLGGTFSAGTIAHFQGSMDGTNWHPLNGRRSGTAATNDITTDLLADVPGGQGVQWYRGNVAGIRFFRVSVTPYTAADSVTVGIATSEAIGATFLNAGLPSSTNNIGSLYPAPTYAVGTATGTTAAAAGQVGRVVRASGNVAQATAATLIAAPTGTARLAVTNVSTSNEGATLTVVRLFAGALPAAAGAVAVVNDVWDFAIAPSGGGAAMNFPPNAPWILPAATALSFAVTAATTWAVSVSYYVAAA